MKKLTSRITRRDFLKFAGGTVAAIGGMGLVNKLTSGVLLPEAVVGAQEIPPDKVFAGTDGWISLPANPAIAPYHPDNLAPAPFNAYVFGFQDVTGLTPEQVANQKMKAIHSAPLFWLQEGTQFKLQLLNLGLQMRPDLTDAHTVHFHGFKNAIPFFDGEPTSAVSVPVGRDFTFVYRPHDPGTYMYHCHVEDTEHVHMGMTGLVFIRPSQDGTAFNYGGDTFTKFVYNDGDGSTGFQREFAMLLSEFWAVAHWADSHIQLPEWSDYKPDFVLINGRVFPDTVAPNGSGQRDANGDIVPVPGYEHLQYQPLSSLVTCKEGESVLLRFANLGFTQQSMTLAGIPMRIVGKDATHLVGRDGTDQSFITNTINIAPGESTEAIFKAPAYQGPGAYDTYLLYSRNFNRSDGTIGFGEGAPMTEVRVYPASFNLPDQTEPNT